MHQLQGHSSENTCQCLDCLFRMTGISKLKVYLTKGVSRKPQKLKEGELSRKLAIKTSLLRDFCFRIFHNQKIKQV